MTARRRKPDIEDEPHLTQSHFEPDPSEKAAEQLLSRSSDDLDTQADQSVWDEPASNRLLSGEPPADALTFSRWLGWRWRTSGAGRSWLLTLLVVLGAGPWAIAGALLSHSYGASGFGLLALCVFGPAAEELLKISTCLLVVERRPYLFHSRLQIYLCCVASGVVFAAIENVLYLHVGIGTPSDLLVRWRWTICVALHTGCTFCAAMGVAKAWWESRCELTRPNLSRVMPYLVTAVVIHGVYNAFAATLNAVGFRF